MIGKKSRYTCAEHVRARALFECHRQTGTIKPPPGIMAASINGQRYALSEAETRYEHYLPDARRALRRGL